MTDLQAFFAGYKPAYLTDTDDPALNQLKLLYPSFVLKNETIMFFQNARDRYIFAAKMKDVAIPSPEYYRNVGLALGYPPVAVEFFIEFMENREELEPISAAFDYAGRFFGGRFSDALPIAEWLWQNVPIPPAEVKLTTPPGDEYRVCPCSKRLERVKINCV